MELVKRKWLTVLALLPFVAACGAVGQREKEPKLSNVQARFKGIGLVLVTDAVPGSEMLGVEFFADGQAWPFYAKSLLARRTREIMSYPGGRVPERVRAVWRDNNRAIAPPGGGGGISYGGKVLGEYTIEVASRIPDVVLQDIRAKGGALRLKFRLKPNGLMFGWDIERDGGGISKFEMPGGDFLETRY